MSSITSAIILAGGKGERLRPHTSSKPKVMVEIAGKPMLEWVIAWLKSHGINTIVLATGYRSEVIRDAYGDGQKLNVRLEYSVEQVPLGTGGATKRALSHTTLKAQDNVVVMNGDILTDLNLSEMMTSHQNYQPLVSMLAVPIASPWDILTIDGSDRIVKYADKPKLPYYLNGGVYIFNRQMIELLPVSGNQEETCFHDLVASDFYAFKTDSFWLAVDTVKDLTRAEHFWNKSNT